MTPKNWRWLAQGVVFTAAAALVLDVSWWRWSAGYVLLRLANECFEICGLYVPLFRSGAGAGIRPPAGDAVAKGSPY